MRGLRFAALALICAGAITLTACAEAYAVIKENSPTSPTGVVAQCSDTINNDPWEDNLPDKLDPDCHWDGNAQNEQSYNPNDNSEARDSVVTTTPTGPLGPFGLSGPFVCRIDKGEYVVSFGWTGHAATKVEYRHNNTGSWNDASGLYEAQVSANSYAARRVRADWSTTFRVWNGSTLWITSEAETTCQGGVYACNDKHDNDGDGKVDAEDSGCHVDNDLTKPYVPTDTDEYVPLPPAPTTPGPTTPGPTTPGPTTPPPAGSCSSFTITAGSTSGARNTGTTASISATGCSVTWSSSNHHAVSVGPSGSSVPVSFLNPGSATICANTGSGSACLGFTTNP